MARFTWLGDEDPSVQTVTVFGHTFVKGEPATVPEKDKAVVVKLKANPMFSTEANPEVVDSDEPEPADPEAGTEKAALKAKLAEYGVRVQGNPSEDTLRNKLAEAVGKAQA
jgi:hypothetical protein